jgi:hypothetical protein
MKIDFINEVLSYVRCLLSYYCEENIDLHGRTVCFSLFTFSISDWQLRFDIIMSK